MKMKKYSLMFGAALMFMSLGAQGKKPATDWHYSKPDKKNMGISLYEAYQSTAAKNASTSVVVAVIDGGTDVNHEDLKDVIWVNSDEIPGNGIDDDKNGYIDDVNGWNFIGGADGGMVSADNLESVRVYQKLSKKFENLDAATIDQNSSEYALYQKLKADVTKEQKRWGGMSKQFNMMVEALKKIQTATGKEDPSAAELEAASIEDPLADAIAKSLAKGMKKSKNGESFLSVKNELQDQLNHVESRANFHYNPEFDSRKIVGDDYSNSSQRIYGNNNVIGPDASHGTHVAGIIAATRSNNVGFDGIADNAKIMVVRVVPDGDERDKDVANGIRYAVDNGAKIINMSFGKGYSWDKNIVDSAVSYAESKGVLLVHAAGNSGQDNDVTGNFPNDSLWGGKRFAANWIEIGASQPERKKLATNFSNYGKNNVDLFAPGQDIYSTIPNNKYEYFDGTSMAAPVVSGVAALVWSRYPNLTAVQMKEILMKSSVKLEKKVIRPHTQKEKVKFSELCVSSGLVNAKAALELAATYK
jgi:subtilisin family serine protease